MMGYALGANPSYVQPPLTFPDIGEMKQAGRDVTLQKSLTPWPSPRGEGI